MALRVLAIVPARDEEDRVPETLRALESIPGLIHVIVVDDGSRDATAAAGRASCAEVLSSGSPGRPAGKGGALLRGLGRAREHAPDAVLVADADLGPSAARLSGLLGLLDEAHPVAVATFPPSTGGGFGLVKNLARREIFRRTGYSPAEPLSGQRAILLPALDALPGLAPGFGAEVGMTLDFLAAGIKPLEIPLRLEHRATGRDVAGFVHRGRQGLDILRAFYGARIPW